MESATDCFNKVIDSQNKVQVSMLQKSNNNDVLKCKLNDLLPSCGPNCRKKCHQRLDECDRRNIFTNFMKLDNSGRMKFLYNWIKQNEVKRRTKGTQSKRKFTNQYYLPRPKVKNGKTIVCKKMFMHTLGMKLCSDVFKQSNLRNYVKTKSPSQERNWVFAKQQEWRIDELIKHHVYSFKYDPHDESNKNFLPKGLSTKCLWRDFYMNYMKISYGRYLSSFESLNVGFGIIVEIDTKTSVDIS